jgi:hypothetical protein
MLLTIDSKGHLPRRYMGWISSSHQPKAGRNLRNKIFSVLKKRSGFPFIQKIYTRAHILRAEAQINLVADANIVSFLIQIQTKVIVQTTRSEVSMEK